MRILPRLLRGIAANGIGQVISVLIQIVSVPIFIGFWGVGLYGEWLILSTVPAYLVMSDIGFASVAANEMTMQVSQGRRSSALTVFQSTWLLISCVSLLAAFFVLAIIWFLPFEDWFHLTRLTHFEVVGVVVLLTLHVLVGLQGKMLSAGFRCEGNYARGTVLNSLVRLFEYGAVAVVVCFGASPIIAAVAFLALRCVGTVGMRIALYKQSPWIIYGYDLATLHTIKRLARPAFAFMAFPLGSAFKDQGIVTVIGVVLGPPAVVVFSTLRTIINAGYNLVSMINQAVWPEISMAFGAKKVELARALHRHACQASMWVSFLFVAGLFFAGEWIIKIWTLGKVIPEPSFFYLMLSVSVANSLWYASSMVPLAINRHEKVALFYLGVAGTSLLLAIWLIPVFGLNGAALALLIINLLCCGKAPLKKTLSLMCSLRIAFILLSCGGGPTNQSSDWGNANSSNALSR